MPIYGIKPKWDRWNEKCGRRKDKYKANSQEEEQDDMGSTNNEIVEQFAQHRALNVRTALNEHNKREKMKIINH